MLRSSGAVATGITGWTVGEPAFAYVGYCGSPVKLVCYVQDEEGGAILRKLMNDS